MGVGEDVRVGSGVRVFVEVGFGGIVVGTAVESGETNGDVISGDLFTGITAGVLLGNS